MTDLTKRMIKKKWYCNLKYFLDEDMLNDISEKFGDEIDEAIARLIYVIEYCQREDISLTPEMATGVIFSVLIECASLTTYPDMGDVWEYGDALAKETGYKD